MAGDHSAALTEGKLGEDIMKRREEKHRSIRLWIPLFLLHIWAFKYTNLSSSSPDQGKTACKLGLSVSAKGSHIFDNGAA